MAAHLQTVIKAGTARAEVVTSFPTKPTKLSSYTPQQSGRAFKTSSLHSTDEAARSKVSARSPNQPSSGSPLCIWQWCGTNWRWGCRTMKLYVTLVIIASFTHTVLVSGKKCDSYCAACWSSTEAGVDIKFTCGNGHCGNSCPSGYERLHCATAARCL